MYAIWGKIPLVSVSVYLTLLLTAQFQSGVFSKKPYAVTNSSGLA
jgi:hypothetical protein